MVDKLPDTPAKGIKVFEDPIIFAVRQRFYYKGAKIETLTRDQLLALLTKILKKEVLK